MMPEIIYCADGNEEFARLAIQAELTYGSQPLKTFYHPIDFADLDPDQIPPIDKYVEAIKQHRPRIATVKDWAVESELPEVLGWAEEIAPLVESIIIIPKVMNGISQLPKKIGGKQVVLGYSVPTSHSGTQLPEFQFISWPVHLLGGSPQKQRKLARYLNVVSVDGNMMHKMATGDNKTGIVAVWQPDSRKFKKGHWVGLDEYLIANGLPPVGNDDAPYRAFEISCQNIKALWQE